jgi:formylglycine-generating enzyme required for sulfatase activity
MSFEIITGGGEGRAAAEHQTYNRVVVRRYRSIIIGFVVGVFSGVLCSVLEDRLKLYFADRDMATISVTAADPIVREFGIVQVWQAGSPIQQRRLRDAEGPTLTIRVAAGVYEIRLQVLDKKFVLDEQRFDRGAAFRYSDEKLPPPEFFSDREFVAVAAGVFTQGSSEFKVSSPAHEVSLSAFRIRSTPVTSCEYASYLAAGRYLQAGSQADDAKVCSGLDARKPAVWVAWEDAKKFCTWLSAFKRQSFRLPTEAEYERAMRIAHERTRYPWGDSEYDPEKPRAPLANYREYWVGGAKPDLSPVKTFPEVGGLYDISGNVWEWTSDWYDARFYSKGEAKLPDTRGPAKGDLHEVVVRGGSCQDPIERLSCAFRGGVDPAIGYYNVGFRVVK